MKKIGLFLVAALIIICSINAFSMDVASMFKSADIKSGYNFDKDRSLDQVMVIYNVKKYLSEKQVENNSISKIKNKGLTYNSKLDDENLQDISKELNTDKQLAALAKHIEKNLTDGNSVYYGPVAELALEYIEIRKTTGRANGIENMENFFNKVLEKSYKMAEFYIKDENTNQLVMYNRLAIAIPGENNFIKEDTLDDGWDASLWYKEPQIKRGETRGYDFSLVISNDVFTDVSMSTEEIQAFFDERKSCLKDKYGDEYPAAILAHICHELDVNPKLIISTIQKEKGLISRETATKSRLDWALGVGCFDDGTKNTRFKGLDKQIRFATETFRTWYDDGLERDITKNGFKIKVNYGKAWQSVRNEGTYSLYRYTPHTYDYYVYNKTGKKSGGNLLLIWVWNGFFGKNTIK
ncbi:MAG: hypothetical protein C0601_00020 [Candidatus Muiribacterium halophilum]|uniref:Mannosyl-glycoprotein endo-beta-N-acetylglucosamidase-like domain-containing protein n=1 Tax=Muiribacterium halophilum TaxID=2053465 RepID=A0A2N5ZNJ8_MUIH1|nr:MAG: hypothetical protein C0601_00020 [Candidatus Muirbacterium halophilum]